MQRPVTYPRPGSMPRTMNPLVLIVLLALATENASHAADPKAATTGPVIEFNRDIRPILSNKCIACHGPDQKQRKAELRLDTEASAKESVIVAGDIDSSELVNRITSTDKELQMPPPGSGKTLNETEISEMIEMDPPSERQSTLGDF